MRWWLVLLSGLLLLLLFGGAWAEENCVKCHPAELKVYTHPSYLKKRCGDCHLRVGALADQGKVPIGEVKWWREVELLRGEYYLPLPGRISRRPLVVKSEEPELEKLLSPDLASSFNGPKEAPKLKRVYPCDVVQGVSTSVALCFEASWPFEAEVECEGGVRGFAEGYATVQKVWLDGLRPGEYRCRVRAHFLNDGEAQREVEFHPRKINTVNFPPAGAEGEVSAEIREVDGVRYLYLSSPGRVRVRVGYLPVSFRREVRKQVQDEAHKGLRPPEEVATYACYRCHEKHSLGASHPVDVVYTSLNGKVRDKPEGLPLFGGRVACASCHEPHTSAKPYLLRKSGKDLCLSCHLPRYF